MWTMNKFDETCINHYDGTDKVVIIPEGFTQLMGGCFSNNDSVEEVILSNTIKVINKHAFCNCRNLRKITANAVVFIWNEFATECINLTEIVIPDEHERYASNAGIIYTKDRKCIEMALEGVSGKITIPEPTEEINTGAFENCRKITAVSFPETLRRIEPCAFMNCNEIEEIVIPSGVEYIGFSAFDKKISPQSEKPSPLKRIVISTSAYNSMTILENTFYFDADSKALVYPELPISVMKGKDDKRRLAFGFCLHPELYSGDYYNLYLKYVKSQRKNLMNAAAKYQVTGIDRFFDQLDAAVAEKKIPVHSKEKKSSAESVKETASRKSSCGKTVAEYKKDWIYADGGFDKSVTGADTITGIILKKYKGQDTNIEIPAMIGKKAVVGIGSNAFADNQTICEVTVPASVYNIGDNAFGNCKNLKSVLILGDIISINSQAFSECTTLEKFVTTASKISAGMHPFHGSEKMFDKNGFVIIGSDGNRVLCDYKLPVTSAKIVIPDGITKVDGSCFGKVFFLGDDFKANDALEEIHFPESVKEIGDKVFSGCKNLRTVILPEGLQSIGTMTFIDCSGLREIKMPASLSSIGGASFMRCSNLTLLVKKDSFSETYAKEHNLTVKYY